MFCQNCGKDCTDARFCPECGQELSAAAEEKQVTNIRSRIPFGKYKAACCSLELKEEGLVVHSSFANKNKATYIPYDKLKKVLYIRTYNAIEDAYLVLRWEENEQLPIPEGNNLNLDDTTVRIVDHMVEHLVFYHIFYLLKLLAPAAEFRIENSAVNIPNLEKLEKDHDIAPYFEEYNPCRQVATKMLRKDTGMKKKAAKVLVDRYFDSQHKVRYEEDLEAIFKDLNIALMNLRTPEEVMNRQAPEVDAFGEAVCPKCGCTDVEEEIYRSKSPYKRPLYVPSRGTPIVLLISILRLLLAIIVLRNTKQVKYVCRNCGFTWEPENAKVIERDDGAPVSNE